MSEKKLGEGEIVSTINFARNELLKLVSERLNRNILLAVLALRVTERVCTHLAQCDEEDMATINRLVGNVLDSLVLVPLSSLPPQLRGSAGGVYRIPLPNKGES